MTTAPRFAQLTIIGFGLIGGSVAMAARERGLTGRVVAVDRPEAIRSAAAREAADELVDMADTRAVDEAVAGAELVLLATPVSVICASAGRVLAKGQLVTDCGSTKRAIVRSVARSERASRFVPGHPMAGDPRGGIEHARANLFEGRSWILCPEGCDPGALERIEQFVTALGATPRRMSAEDHDRAVAVTSHLPKLLASLLSVLASERDAEIAAGPAFESATRVAGGQAQMWRDILATNADEVGKATRELSEQLARVARGLEAGDLEPALELLERARRMRSR